MTVKPQVQLLLNDERRYHGKILAKLLPGTKHLECMVAFAKTSGLRLIHMELDKGLETGLNARFAVGLDFCLTEPALLRQLFGLSGRHRLKLYLSNSSATFHPKIYALSRDNGCTVMIGSANLTGGGLQHNYESSAWIDDPSGSLMQSVSKHIDDLIAQKVILPATQALIDDYERRYAIHQAQQKLVKRRIERANTQAGINTETLHDVLLEMKSDDSEHGFESHQIVRRLNRRAAARKIKELAAMKNLDANTFLTHYEQLIGLFHSGGLHRGKNIIANNADQFHRALVAIVNAGKLSPRDAYQMLLEHFRHIPRAGVNVLTEILHAIDSKRFAVMNQNAVAGLRLANIHVFPSNPTKTSVDADLYAHYCQQADVVRKELGLADFTELDALFNYAYWGHREEAAEDE